MGVSAIASVAVGGAADISGAAVDSFTSAGAAVGVGLPDEHPLIKDKNTNIAEVSKKIFFIFSPIKITIYRIDFTLVF